MAARASRRSCIPASVTIIGDYLAWDCTRLTSLVLPASVTSIGDSLAYRCTSLTSLVLPASVTSIGDSLAWGCTRLTSLVLPDSVTSIGDSLAYRCTSLTTLVIPAGVTSIGHRLAYGCTRLAETARWRMTSRGWLAHDLRVGLLTIGCQSHPVAWWVENAETIAAENDATPEERAELKAVIEKFQRAN
jgi:hypothetical protein